MKSVTVKGDRAEVVVRVNGNYEYWEYFARSDGGAWHPTVEGNGPTWGWDDVSVIEW